MGRRPERDAVLVDGSFYRKIERTSRKRRTNDHIPFGCPIVYVRWSGEVWRDSDGVQGTGRGGTNKGSLSEV